MSSCQTFRTKIGDIDCSPLQGLLEAVMNNPDEATQKILSDALDPVKKGAEALRQEFQQRVKDMLEQWYFPIFSQRQEFLNCITFEEDTQRVIFDGTLEFLSSPVKYFPSLIRGVTGLLVLTHTIENEHVDSLEFVNDRLLVASNAIKSLSGLRYVGENLNMTNRNVEDLDALEEVKGSFNASESKLSKLGSLRLVWGDLHIDKTHVSSLPNLSGVGNDFIASESDLISAPKLTRVHGDLQISNTKISSLDSLEFVNGRFTASNVPLKSAANLTETAGNLFDYNPRYADIPPSFRGVFPKLKRIGRDTVVISLPTKAYMQEVLELKREGSLDFNGQVVTTYE